MTIAEPLLASQLLPANSFLDDVVAGLTAKNKVLSPKYFYDETGSKYFDEICNLEEYYPYRAELTLLDRVANEVAPFCDQPTAVIEFGAGSLKKIEPLINHITHISQFIPIDICGEHLNQAAKKLRQNFPHLIITPIEADFTEQVTLHTQNVAHFGFFPGSTIGNFTPAEALDFLQNARSTLGKDSRLLVGVDTKKSPEILHNAYNDAQGVTAKFNLNILNRINRELDANLNIKQFDHYAHYNSGQGCVQMHLISRVNQTANIQGHSIDFKAGESIHTENSFKYTPEEFSALAHLAGWKVEQFWLAEYAMFWTFLVGGH